MNCAACNKPLPAAGRVEHAGHAFCDNLCRYAFKKQQDAAPSGDASRSASPERRLGAPTAAASAEAREAPRNDVLTHAMLLAGLAFLLVTRYKLYVVGPAPDVHVATALGANLAYFTIWVAAYWIARTTPRGHVNAILGLLATVSAPMTMPLIGFGIVVNMYLIKRGQLMK